MRDPSFRLIIFDRNECKKYTNIDVTKDILISYIIEKLNDEIAIKTLYKHDGHNEIKLNNNTSIGVYLPKQLNREQPNMFVLYYDS